MSEVQSHDLHDTATAARFYDERFRHGYMDDWSSDKCRRVEALVRELGLPKTGRALDFGCGAGLFTAALAKALPGWTIEGTDLSNVAIQNASKRVPGARFFPLDQCADRRGAFDFIFTHHVLEHVPDMPLTSQLLAEIAKPSAVMLHILPCGNAGSFEHGVCLLRTDGIRKNPEGTFFFEEEGHLRRLDTSKLVALWSGAGFRLNRAWYAGQVLSAITTRTSFGLGDVLAFADPAKAKSPSAALKLTLLRAGMSGYWLLRKPLAVVRNKRRFGCHNARDYALLAASTLCLPVSWGVEQLARFMTEYEWRRRQTDSGGSEMYISLARG